MKKKYKALILDVDGTLIPNKKNGIPSQKVISSILSVNGKLHVGVATSRPQFLLKHIFNYLKLSGPSIINAGSQIIDAESGKVFWEKSIEKKNCLELFQILNALNIPFFIQDGKKDIKFTKNFRPKTIYNIGALNLNPYVVEKFLEKTSHLSTVAVHRIPAWEKGKITIVISHSEATKQHAIFEVAKLLNINTHEIIGVGDGYNDFPLLMACGLKIAMGNAVDELKEIADYIAPTVQNDGVADIIEKFIL